ncbi:MAG: hypothetical protein Fur0010_18240 [Bdellovibrio sp.]
MDKLTIERYQKDAALFIDNYKSVKPRRVYELIAAFFKNNERTLDIGCASGRDLAYLSGAGYKVEGIDPVPAFVEHCKNSLTNIPIYQDSLPKLAAIKEDNKYGNILLSAVLMHLPQELLPESVANILRITKPGGRIFISVRKPREDQLAQDQELREDDYRLFSPIQAQELISLFENLGGKLIFHEEQAESMRSGIVWYNFVFEKRQEKEIIYGLSTLLVFTEDINWAADFYQRCLGLHPIEKSETFVSFKIGSTYLNFHPNENKSPLSQGGSVGHFLVSDLKKAIAPFLENGAKIYRGPLKINSTFAICQIIDPKGHVIGFEGKF